MPAVKVNLPRKVSEAMSDTSASRRPTSRRERNISVDLKSDEKKELTRLAKESNMSLAEYVRAALTELIEEEAKFQKSYTRKD